MLQGLHTLCCRRGNAFALAMCWMHPHKTRIDQHNVSNLHQTQCTCWSVPKDKPYQYHCSWEEIQVGNCSDPPARKGIVMVTGEHLSKSCVHPRGVRSQTRTYTWTCKHQATREERYKGSCVRFNNSRLFCLLQHFALHTSPLVLNNEQVSTRWNIVNIILT